MCSYRTAELRIQMTAYDTGETVTTFLSADDTGQWQWIADATTEDVPTAILSACEVVQAAIQSRLGVTLSDKT